MHPAHVLVVANMTAATPVLLDAIEEALHDGDFDEIILGAAAKPLPVAAHGPAPPSRPPRPPYLWLCWDIQSPTEARTAA